MADPATDWHPMDTAPRDGTWLRGIDAHGNECRMQFRAIHPKVPDVGQWFEGEPQQQGHWLKSKCFYPVGWQEEEQANG